MNLNDVSGELGRIRSLAGDPEAAHGAEDDLYRRVLEAIANRTTEVLPRTLARRALDSQQIDFPRWAG